MIRTRGLYEPSWTDTRLACTLNLSPFLFLLQSFKFVPWLTAPPPTSIFLLCSPLYLHPGLLHQTSVCFQHQPRAAGHFVKRCLLLPSIPEDQAQNDQERIRAWVLDFQVILKEAIVETLDEIVKVEFEKGEERDKKKFEQESAFRGPREEQDRQGRLKSNIQADWKNKQTNKQNPKKT